jgi:hypothetical protein
MPQNMIEYFKSQNLFNPKSESKTSQKNSNIIETTEKNDNNTD